jgi:hypothetical protein
MGSVWLVLAYLAGGVMLGGGIFLLLSGSFPGRTAGWMLLPVVHATPTVSRLLGGVAVGLGASVLALDISTLVSQFTGGLLVLAGIAVYLIAVGLYVFSTWLSRRTPPTQEA